MEVKIILDDSEIVIEGEFATKILNYVNGLISATLVDLDNSKEVKQ